MTPSQKVGKTDFNPLLTSPDLRGRNISSSLPTNLGEDNDAIDAWSPPKIGGDSEGVDTSLPAFR